MLELLEVLERKGRHILQGHIIIGVDNRRVYWKIVEDIKKASTYIQDTGVEILQIKKLLSKIRYEVEIQLQREYQKTTDPFQSNPIAYLVAKCNRKAK